MAGGGAADRFDHDIVTFMRSWAPYGGPPDDEALLEFGMTREQLVHRYRQILAAEAARREWELRRPWLRQRQVTATREKAQAPSRPARPATFRT
jgi:hypothetical protein